jgi:uncharacterized heparinase superfamily protein
MRATAAHSTLTLADTNSSELRDEGLGRRPERVEIERQEANGAQWLDASHDGYRRTHGVVHRRASTRGQRRRADRRGCAGAAARARDPLRAALPPAPRRHRVLQEEEGGVLMRLPGGQGWRMRARGARIALEDSVSMSGEPRRAQQVVLTADGEAESVQWGLARIVPPASEATEG